MNAPTFKTLFTLKVLFRVELPNAVPIIIGGVRVALAINVGTAPLAFLIGANSLGSLIFPGIALILFGLAWNLVGDALRDILDPKLRGKQG